MNSDTGFGNKVNTSMRTTSADVMRIHQELARLKTDVRHMVWLTGALLCGVVWLVVDAFF